MAREIRGHVIVMEDGQLHGEEVDPENMLIAFSKDEEKAEEYRDALQEVIDDRKFVVRKALIIIDGPGEGNESSGTH